MATTTAPPPDATTTPEPAALVDELAAAIAQSMPPAIPDPARTALMVFVSGIRARAAGMFPAGAPPLPPKELAARGAELARDLDKLEDLLEAFLLFPPPPDGA